MIIRLNCGARYSAEVGVRGHNTLTMKPEVGSMCISAIGADLSARSNHMSLQTPLVLPVRQGRSMNAMLPVKQHAVII